MGGDPSSQPQDVLQQVHLAGWTKEGGACGGAAEPGGRGASHCGSHC